MMALCYCGDADDEHDPNTKACSVEGCVCFHYEEDPEQEEGEDDGVS